MKSAEIMDRVRQCNSCGRTFIQKYTNIFDPCFSFVAEDFNPLMQKALSDFDTRPDKVISWDQILQNLKISQHHDGNKCM